MLPGVRSHKHGTLCGDPLVRFRVGDNEPPVVLIPLNVGSESSVDLLKVLLRVGVLPMLLVLLVGEVGIGIGIMGISIGISGIDTTV